MFKKIGWLLVGIVSAVLVTSCGQTDAATTTKRTFTNWEEVVNDGENQQVNFFMWSGNESVNRYIDGYVSEQVAQRYGINLKRVPSSPNEYLTKLINEKQAGHENSTTDLVWINGENFAYAQEAGVLSEGFTHLLPNLQAYYDQNDPELITDAGVDIQNQEAIWGKAQLVFTYDSVRLPNPPQTYAELLTLAKQMPGKITFPIIPDDFVGTAFFRNAYYEFVGEQLSPNLTEAEFMYISQPVIAYFQELQPYLWNEGKTFPQSQAQLDELFVNGEVVLTMGFEAYKTAGLVANGTYPKTVETYVFDQGTIGNAHYLSIPFNASQPAAAMLVIDFLQSPEAQLEKMKTGVWGDLPAFDTNKLTADQQTQLREMQNNPAIINLQTLIEKKNPEFEAQYIEWAKVAGQNVTNE